VEECIFVLRFNSNEYIQNYKSSGYCSMMWVPMRYFALSVLFWFSIVSSSSLELSHVVRREDIVPKLPWKPKSCYKREQVCCYRYKKCGNRCRTGYCSQQSMCSHYKFGKCFRWRSVNTCTTVCFDKMCVRFECVPLKMVRGRSYVHPRIHTKVYYPQGKNPPKPPKPSRKPRPVQPTRQPRPRPRPRPQPRPVRPPRGPRNPPRPTRPPRRPRKTKPPATRPPRNGPGFFPPGFPDPPRFPAPPRFPQPPPKLPGFPDPPAFPGRGARPPRPPRRSRNRPSQGQRPARKKKKPTSQRPPRGFEPQFVPFDNPSEFMNQ